MTEQTHEVTVNKTRHLTDWWCECSCGAEWRIPYTRKGIDMDTGEHKEYEGLHMDAEVKATIEKHITYAKRMATRID